MPSSSLFPPELAVVVTGGDGFIGRRLTGRLEELGVIVHSWSRATVDVTDARAVAAAMAQARPAVVFHLAAARGDRTPEQRDRTFAVNVTAARILVEAAPEGCRFVRLGSSTELASSERPMNESTPVLPRGFFGATKAAGGIVLAAVADARGLPHVHLRAFQVYGPGDLSHRLIPTAIRAARTGEPLLLTEPGLGRDYVFVDDVVDACVRAATTELPPGTALNIGSGVQRANEEVVATVERATGRPIDVRVGAHPGRSWDSSTWVADPRKAAAVLGWRPSTTFDQGVARAC